MRALIGAVSDNGRNALVAVMREAPVPVPVGADGPKDSDADWRRRHRPARPQRPGGDRKALPTRPAARGADPLVLTRSAALRAARGTRWRRATPGRRGRPSLAPQCPEYAACSQGGGSPASTQSTINGRNPTKIVGKRLSLDRTRWGRIPVRQETMGNRHCP